MNQAALMEWVQARLEKTASGDPQAWVPAVGWTTDAGENIGIAHEVFGPSPSKGDLERLGNALGKMVVAGTIEIAAFRMLPKHSKLPATPYRQDVRWPRLQPHHPTLHHLRRTEYAARLRQQE